MLRLNELSHKNELGLIWKLLKRSFRCNQARFCGSIRLGVALNWIDMVNYNNCGTDVKQPFFLGGTHYNPLNAFAQNAVRNYLSQATASLERAPRIDTGKISESIHLLFWAKSICRTYGISRLTWHDPKVRDVLSVTFGHSRLSQDSFSSN